MKPAGWIAMVIIVAIFLAIYLMRRPIFSSLAQRNYHKRIDMLAEQIGQQGVHDGYELVTTAVLLFNDENKLAKYAERLRLAKRELRRLSSEAKANRDIRDDYRHWVVEGRQLLREAGASELIEPSRPTSQPPSQISRNSATQEKQNHEDPSQHPNAIVPEGRIRIVLNPTCYGPCKIYLFHQGKGRPETFQLLPGEGFNLGLVDPARVSMDTVRSYCKAPDTILDSTLVGSRVTVGCRP